MNQPMPVTKVDRCSMCGKMTSKLVAGHFLCPACCELHGASFAFGAKAAEKILCYYRIAKSKLRGKLKSLLWWR